MASSTQSLGNTDNVFIGPLVANFCHVFQAHTPPGSDTAKFGMDFIMDDATFTKIWAAAQPLVQKAFPQEAATILAEAFNPAKTVKFKWPWQQGKMQPKYYSDVPESWILSSSSPADRQPQLFNWDRTPLLDTGAIYNGVQVCSYVNLWAWRHPTGGPGISCSLEVVLKYADGEPRGRSVDMSDVWSQAGNVAPPPAPAAVPGLTPTPAGLPAPGMPAPGMPQPAPGMPQPAPGMPAPGMPAPGVPQPAPGVPQAPTAAAPGAPLPNGMPGYPGV